MLPNSCSPAGLEDRKTAAARTASLFAQGLRRVLSRLRVAQEHFMQAADAQYVFEQYEQVLLHKQKLRQAEARESNKKKAAIERIRLEMVSQHAARTRALVNSMRSERLSATSPFPAARAADM